MSQAIEIADRHMREALTVLRNEESERVAAFDREMTQLRQRIAVVETALGFCPSVAGQSVLPLEGGLRKWSERPLLPNDPSTPTELPTLLQGLSQPEALLRIAETHGGVLRTVDAKPLLIAAGLIKGNPKNVLGHVFQLLRDDERFAKLGVRVEKIGPGVYRFPPLASDPRTDETEAWGSAHETLANS